MAFWNRTKSFEAATSRATHSALKPTLSWVHLVGSASAASSAPVSTR
jgi:hypothetical protein